MEWYRTVSALTSSVMDLLPSLPPYPAPTQILKPAEKKTKVQYSGIQAARPGTPPRNPVAPKKK
jgi:hypothetical protein